MGDTSYLGIQVSSVHESLTDGHLIGREGLLHVSCYCNLVLYLRKPSFQLGSVEFTPFFERNNPDGRKVASQS
jgi:hypothetical protein